MNKKILISLLLATSLMSCDNTQSILGNYTSLNNGSVEITAFDGDEGEFLANNLILARLNNGQPYTTPSNETEIFAVARVVNNNYTIRFSVDGVAYIGNFDLNAMSITVEGTTYAIIS